RMVPCGTPIKLVLKPFSAVIALHDRINKRSPRKGTKQGVGKALVNVSICHVDMPLHGVERLNRFSTTGNHTGSGSQSLRRQVSPNAGSIIVAYIQGQKGHIKLFDTGPRKGHNGGQFNHETFHVYLGRQFIGCSMRDDVVYRFKTYGCKPDGVSNVGDKRKKSFVVSRIRRIIITLIRYRYERHRKLAANRRDKPAELDNFSFLSIKRNSVKNED